MISLRLWWVEKSSSGIRQSQLLGKWLCWGVLWTSSSCKMFLFRIKLWAYVETRGVWPLFLLLWQLNTRSTASPRWWTMWVLCQVLEKVLAHLCNWFIMVHTSQLPLWFENFFHLRSWKVKKKVCSFRNIRHPFTQNLKKWLKYFWATGTLPPSWLAASAASCGSWLVSSVQSQRSSCYE